MRRVVQLRVRRRQLAAPPGADGPRRPAEIAATVMLLASVVRTAQRAGSKVRNTGAKERASLGLGRPREPSCRAAKRRQRCHYLGVTLHKTVVVVGQLCEATPLAARRRRRSVEDLLRGARRPDRRGLKSGWSHCHGRNLGRGLQRRKLHPQICGQSPHRLVDPVGSQCRRQVVELRLRLCVPLVACADAPQVGRPGHRPR